MRTPTLLCASATGHDLLQPSTALLAACFLLLLRNLLRFAVAGFRRAQQQRKQQQHLPGAGDGALGGLAAAAGAALGVGPEGEMQGEAEGVEDEQVRCCVMAPACVTRGGRSIAWGRCLCGLLHGEPACPSGTLGTPVPGRMTSARLPLGARRQPPRRRSWPCSSVWRGCCRCGTTGLAWLAISGRCG